MTMKPAADVAREWMAQVKEEPRSSDPVVRLIALIERSRAEGEAKGHSEGRADGLEAAALRCEKLVREDGQIVGAAAQVCRRCANVIRWIAAADSVPAPVAPDDGLIDSRAEELRHRVRVIDDEFPTPPQPAPQKMTPERLAEFRHIGTLSAGMEAMLDGLLMSPGRGRSTGWIGELIAHIDAQAAEIRALAADCDRWKSQWSSDASTIAQCGRKLREANRRIKEGSQRVHNLDAERHTARAEIKALTERLANQRIPWVGYDPAKHGADETVTVRGEPVTITESGVEREQEPATFCDFGTARAALVEGWRVRRPWWGNGIWLTMVEGDIYLSKREDGQRRGSVRSKHD